MIMIMITTVAIKPMCTNVCRDACRDRFNVSTSLPFLYGQRVKMVWKDATDPTRGEWYEGTVSRSEEWGHGLPPGATWEGVSVMWDVDRSESAA